MMRKALFTTFCLSTFLSPFVWGWWDTGHMAIAKIAYDRLSPRAQEQVDEWSSIIGNEFAESNDFVTAACWISDLQENHLPLFAVWEENSNDCLSNKEIIKKDSSLSNNINKHPSIKAIHQCSHTLANPAAGQWAKAFALRLLIHLVAEIHQPLQMNSHQHFFQGDEQGHPFAIQGTRPITNLFTLWESIFGLALPRLPRPLEPADALLIQGFSQSVAQRYPDESLQEREHLLPEEWLEESDQLVQKEVFQGVAPDAPLSPEYLEKGKEICLRRIALAGYRLSDLLNSVVE